MLVVSAAAGAGGILPSTIGGVDNVLSAAQAVARLAYASRARKYFRLIGDVAEDACGIAVLGLIASNWVWHGSILSG
jgi:hypothetical protein